MKRLFNYLGPIIIVVGANFTLYTFCIGADWSQHDRTTELVFNIAAHPILFRILLGLNVILAGIIINAAYESGNKNDN